VVGAIITIIVLERLLNAEHYFCIEHSTRHLRYHHGPAAVRLRCVKSEQ
jgi:hypothetical protein